MARPIAQAAERHSAGRASQALRLLLSLALLSLFLGLLLWASPSSGTQALRGAHHRRQLLQPGQLLGQPFPLHGPQWHAAAAAGTGSPASEFEQPLQRFAPQPPSFDHTKVVALVAFDRFEYFRRMVQALARAWGSGDYILAITVDGPPANASAYDAAGWRHVVAYSQQLVAAAARGRGPFRQVLLNVSASNRGLWPNKKAAVAGAFALSDFVVVLEDDIVLEPDALRWFEWHAASGLIFTRPELALATCWSASFPYHPAPTEAHDTAAVRTLGMLDKYALNPWATPWGWATWSRTWDALGANWTGQDLHLGRMVQAAGWFETHPLVARCNNIGAVGFHKQGQGVGHIHQRAVTSGDFPGLERCTYREIPHSNGSTSLGIQGLGLYRHVRNGIFPAGLEAGVDEYAATLEGFRQRYSGEPADLESTC